MSYTFEDFKLIESLRDAIKENTALQREMIDYQKKLVEEARAQFQNVASMISIDVQGSGKA